MIYFRPIGATEIQMYIDTMAGLIANSLAFVKQVTEGGNSKGLEGVGRELDALRSLYKET